MKSDAISDCLLSINDKYYRNYQSCYGRLTAAYHWLYVYNYMYVYL